MAVRYDSLVHTESEVNLGNTNTQMVSVHGKLPKRRIVLLCPKRTECHRDGGSATDTSNGEIV